ncbi:diphosphomevalonate decarboxylase [Thiomicrospira microaerophila]|uniref:diphosphomevalonate decarboxylase n=1 Tax=Thiomicrospira microaerophila TaxID=406020 RepID=UPI00200F393B|nr:diphosphomevalonate decarboxylase [Thiomicrospira microaerophila]UQB42820.1 diphosphomevalonate decarboxylase [Thiomicrospira microaerophila]
MLSRQAIIKQIIPHLQPNKKIGKGCADVNIALSKYWGKRQVELNLPTNSSLSVSLPGLGTQTELSLVAGTEHQTWLNHQQLDTHNPFSQRLADYLTPFCPAGLVFNIRTHNTVPTAAGLASSASGYAALVLALNDLFDWQLSDQHLSILARIGSGSASRSIYNGFSIWHKGTAENGMDSYAEHIDQTWPALCIGLVKVNIEQKPIGSTAGMQQTVKHCDLYQAWPNQAERQVQQIHQAIQQRDFSQLGQLTEHNALSMHATMLATWPPILYWQAESIIAMQQVWQLRHQGIEVYFTMDAGPNLKLLFLEDNKKAVETAFDGLEIIQPFKKSTAT